MKRKLLKVLLLGSAIFAAQSATAAEVNGLTNFTAGTPAVASEVNDNFAAVKMAVDDNHATIASLTATIATLQSTIADLQARLAGVTRETVNGQPTVRFTGVNVQIVNGQNATNTVNGVGNLIIGYDEPYDVVLEFCSIGVNPPGTLIRDVGACTAVGGTFASSHKSGSHNLIVGPNHNYSRFGGAAIGQRNIIINDFAVVTGGRDNIAAGRHSSVGGGSGNNALGTESSVTSGRVNVASGLESSVSGGFANSATGTRSSVSGGRANDATGSESSVSGGELNNASATNSTVSGGRGRSANDVNDWVAGTLLQNQ